MIKKYSMCIISLMLTIGSLNGTCSITVKKALKKGRSVHSSKKGWGKNRKHKTKAAVPTQISLQGMLQVGRGRLRHISSDQKNLYAKEILSQTSFYDARLDVDPFIKKLRIDDGFLLKNKTECSISCEIRFLSKDTGAITLETVQLEAGTYRIFPKPDKLRLNGIKLVQEDATIFLNPKFTIDGHLQISIEQVEDRFFLHQFHGFDFMVPLFSQEQLTDPGISYEEQAFRNDFNNACMYLNYVGHQEGASFLFIQQQRANLYAKNNFARLCKYEKDLLDSTTHRIPLITHKIWVTSDDNPKGPSIQYIKWLENSIAHNNLPADGWTHYFWIERKEKLPELAALLENHPNIVLRELDELNTTDFETGDLYKEAIKNRKFGKASDIIRLELLKKFGGFYLDTDYELYQSLAPYAKAYDMILGLEPMSPYLCNAFIGSCPNHPVLNKALEMIIRNLGAEAPEYIKNAPDTGFKTIIETGPAMLTLAFALAGGSGVYRDIVLPPQLIYPAQAGLYPYKHVVKPDGKIPAEALGAHYWNTAWMDPQFGSNG